MTESVEQKSQQQESSENGTSESGPDSGVPDSDAAAPTLPAVRPKYRYDWYQTEGDVCISILIKKVKKENVHVDFQEKMVNFGFNILNLSLWVIHNRCVLRSMTTCSAFR